MCLSEIAVALSDAVSRLDFSPPVTHVYNPLEYARAPHLEYLDRYGNGRKDVVFLGMNPGPWGMVQTGVPFGQIEAVRDWLTIEARARRPEAEHPKRPVEGLDCRRSEVSGRRLWGWARDRFGRPERFFQRFFIANYCPLAFLEESGRNRTPDKLPAGEREALIEACDRALAATVDCLRPTWVVGVGRFAEERALAALTDRAAPAHVEVRVGRGLHPSPASPAANRGWAVQWERDLRALGIEIP